MHSRIECCIHNEHPVCTVELNAVYIMNTLCAQKVYDEIIYKSPVANMETMRNFDIMFESFV
jgi:hypothetical protein